MNDPRPDRDVTPADLTSWRTPPKEIDVDAVLLTRCFPCGAGEIVIEIGVPRRVEGLLGTELPTWDYANLPYACRFRVRGHHGDGSAHSGYMGGRDAFDSLAAAMSISHNMALTGTAVDGEIRTASDTSMAILQYVLAPEHRGITPQT